MTISRSIARPIARPIAGSGGGGGPEPKRCFNFDGVNDYVSLGNVAAIIGSITISAWIAPTTYAVLRSYVVAKATGSFSAGYGFDVEANGKIRWLIGNGALRSLTSTGAAPLDTWTHVATTYDGTTLAIYLNGVLDSSLAVAGGAMTADTNALVIGAFSSGTINFAGKAFDVQILPAALSGADIAEIVSDGASALPAATRSLWIRCDESSGTTAADSSGDGHDGTITGAGESFFYEGADVPFAYPS